MSNDFFQLPFQFDKKQLLHDLNICVDLSWLMHFNSNDFTGEWKSIALRSISGESTDIYAHPNAVYQDTALLNQCDYFKAIVDSFECEKESIRLLSLAAGSCINTHVDQEGGYADGFHRIHVPIQTNSLVEFVVNGQNVPMKDGECWYADFSLPHSVTNKSNEARIHLVIDCKRNQWSDELFKQCGYDFTVEQAKNKYDNQTILKIIAELELMESPVTKELIEQLKSQLN
ncbi:aspartyl/asparaginyl beta-hydroxylase domain-containing protein [Solitalea longa]|uniref:Aspartyl/asparaginyl beta-hydroxylase domain-containing protein n=1 Tax=Solitalea longa TaxID=2079460 RepID=A0A2S4ZZ96_9SPHI|nr:aspartyl/asparaginyl beta-hydroxylase domain-containing protein [Solitalea longa]POY35674.1 aspartyl/asparaginyl beta-hydroxylase domain-containing protein [Solitalea longa]